MTGGVTGGVTGGALAGSPVGEPSGSSPSLEPPWLHALIVAIHANKHSALKEALDERDKIVVMDFPYAAVSHYSTSVVALVRLKLNKLENAPSITVRKLPRRYSVIRPSA